MQRSCLLFAITTDDIPAVTRSQAVCQYIIRALCSLSMDAGSAGFQVDHTAEIAERVSGAAALPYPRLRQTGSLNFTRFVAP